MHHTLLIGIDFSECSYRAARYAFHLSRSIGSKIILVHLFGSGDIEQESQKLLDLAKEARFPPKMRLEAKENELAMQLIRTAQEEKASLILVGSKGFSQDQHSRRTLQRLIEDSPIPIMVFSQKMHCSSLRSPHCIQSLS